MKNISIGTIANPETIEALRTQITQTGIATVVAQLSAIETTAMSWSTRQLVDADPEIIIVDIADAPTALQTLQYLHTALPSARLLAISGDTDPQLIIELMRAGVREFLPSPVSATALLQAFNRYVSEKNRATVHSQQRARQGKLYCIMSAKHGSGATTLALNMAGSIAAKSKMRTAIIDLDRPLGDVASYLNVKPNFTVTDALTAGPRLDPVLLESYMQPSHGLYILPGFRELSADTSLPSDRLAQLLEMAQASFDHTIVDLPTNLDEEQIKVIGRSCSVILVVLTPELPAIWRTERLLTYLTQLHVSEKVRIVLNRSSRSDEITDADIERVLRTPLYCKLPNEYSSCIRAINSGALLENVNSKHLNKAIAALAASVAGLPETERRGLFGMLLKPSIGGTNA